MTLNELCSLPLYLEESASHEILDERTEYLLMTKAKEGDIEARDRIVAANQRLVIQWANKYISIAGMTNEIMDLIQWGNEGVIKAIEKFDLSRGFRFSTYAVWQIRRYIRRNVLQQESAFSVSSSAAELLPKVANAHQQLVSELDREPSIAEIAERIGCLESSVASVWKVYDGCISLDSPIIVDEGVADILECIVDPDTEIPEESICKREVNEVLLKGISLLGKQANEVIQLRFGLRDGIRYTLQEIAPMLGVSAETVRVIEKRALNDLRLYLESRSRQ